MKLLVAYDGSDCSDAALEDLHRAGLPLEVSAKVFSVVDETVESALYPVEAVSFPMAWYPLLQPDSPSAPAKQIKQTRQIACRVADRLRCEFPAWSVEIDSACGPPGALIADQVDSWKPDLVVMGSHGRRCVGRFVLGSVSQHVLNHAHCAVRIVRRSSQERSGPIRLLIAFDGSADAAHAQRAVAGGNWPAGTLARVIGVVDAAVPFSMPGMSLDEDRLSHGVGEFRRQLPAAVCEAACDLSGAGLETTHEILIGDPSSAITKDALTWNADCIVLGARGVSAIHRLLLGSISSEVAARAHCSVEVFRHPAGSV
jgi:nucleotide-binding universal stress UspA family protein